MLLGAHVSIAGGVSQAVSRARADGGRAFQLFTRSARGWSSPPLDTRECQSFREALVSSGMSCIAHGSYLTNLASADEVLWEKSVASLSEELRRCHRLGVPQLVFHPGSHPDVNFGLARVAEGIDAVHRACPRSSASLCLEVTAGQGHCLGHRFEHLSAILARVRRPERVGICLDTCHLFAAGYDLRTARTYRHVVAELAAEVGLEKVRCFHLNDSKKGLGCRVDRHEEIGKGSLGLWIFRTLVNESEFSDLPGVLETPHPERYAQSLRLLESLASR